MHRGAGVSFFLDYKYSALLFMLFTDSIYISPVVISFLYSSTIIVLDVYMSYCSDIDLS